MKSYEEILEAMLNNVSDDIDKREGSIIYTALAPCAAALAAMYVDIEIDRRLAFASTSSGTYLDNLVDEVGLLRNPAIKSRRKGLFKDILSNPFNVSVGNRFGYGNISFTALEKITDGEFLLECDIAGESGNVPGGKLLPIDNISGLVTATLTNDYIAYGAEQETDNDLYQRYKLKVQKPITSGNANQYQQWAMSVLGVGSAKVFPLWQGAGTVKVVITNINKQPASTQLITDVFNYIDSVRPIGATVTVISATAKNINIVASIKIVSGYNLNDIKTAFMDSLNEYFKAVALSSSYLSYPKIGAMLFAIDGVSDYSQLTINGANANITLSDSETPVLSTCEVNVL